MPRIPRIRSRFESYHIVMRGINRQNIFIDDDDYKHFIALLHKYKELCGFKLFAYCIMTNHIHLLIKQEKEPIEQIMRRLCGSFVKWYNKKYGRIGYLFQDRYKSEPIDSEQYLLTVIRYIFQNPIKAGLVSSSPSEYKWCNYLDYQTNIGTSETDFILSLFSINKDNAKVIFAEFMNKPSNEICIDIEDTLPITDKEAKRIMMEICDIQCPSEFQKLNNIARDIYIQQLKHKYKISIRQIERLTGVSRGIIARL